MKFCLGLINNSNLVFNCVIFIMLNKGFKLSKPKWWWAVAPRESFNQPINTPFNLELNAKNIIIAENIFMHCLPHCF